MNDSTAIKKLDLIGIVYNPLNLALAIALDEKTKPKTLTALNLTIT